MQKRKKSKKMHYFKIWTNLALVMILIKVTDLNSLV